MAKETKDESVTLQVKDGKVTSEKKVQSEVVQNKPDVLPKRMRTKLDAEMEAGKKSIAMHQARRDAYPPPKAPGERHPNDGSNMEVYRPSTAESKPLLDQVPRSKQSGFPTADKAHAEREALWAKRQGVEPSDAKKQAEIEAAYTQKANTEGDAKSSKK